MNRESDHRLVESFEIDGKWCTPCACGDRFTGASPSTAHGKAAKHVKSHVRTEQNGDRPTVASGATPARAKSCGCGCGGPLAPRAGGLFRSGHDARFKSILTVAHAAGQQVSHPLTGESTRALEIARWLDERRGGGTFWADKVLAGHKPQPERRARLDVSEDAEDRVLVSHARVDKIMEFQATRRPTSGDTGVVKLRSGQFGAQVLRRQDDSNLQIRLLDGTSRGQELVVPDGRFSRAVRR